MIEALLGFGGACLVLIAKELFSRGRNAEIMKNIHARLDKFEETENRVNRVDRELEKQTAIILERMNSITRDHSGLEGLIDKLDTTISENTKAISRLEGYLEMKGQ